MILSFDNGIHEFIEFCGNSKGASSLFMLFRKLIENLINNEFWKFCENLVVESYYTWKYAMKLNMLNLLWTLYVLPLSCEVSGYPT